jgi:hypothetical protein
LNTEFIKVPFYVETNGEKTLFLPNVKMSKGYQISEKGAERSYNDYWEALAQLCRIPTPRFRRRNKNNIPGIVACKPGNVEEVKRSYLEELIFNNHGE